MSTNGARVTQPYLSTWTARREAALEVTANPRIDRSGGVERPRGIHRIDRSSGVEGPCRVDGSHRIDMSSRVDGSHRSHVIGRICIIARPLG